jgi:3'(2'), 5'-bisphosphate nucleotidase
MDHSELIEQVIRIARAAGDEILEVYRSECTVQKKLDASPVTEADNRAEARILSGLGMLTPHVPVVSEEAHAKGIVPKITGRFWLADPLDGTREFVSRIGEFTVNIALVEHGKPVLGVVFAPALGQLFGGARGFGAFVEREGGRRPISCRRPPGEGLTVVSSRSHGDPEALTTLLAGQQVSFVYVGSSLKFCFIASGEADLYPRLGRTMEWDTAAGHAVLAAAGGRVTRLDGSELTYAKPDFVNPEFVAAGLAPGRI